MLKGAVRDGDPLSPLLFVLAADFLQTVINDAMHKWVLQVPIRSLTCDTFPTPQYVDDVHIVMHACQTQLAQLQNLLGIFSVVSGLKVNY